MATEPQVREKTFARLYEEWATEVYLSIVARKHGKPFFIDKIGGSLDSLSDEELDMVNMQSRDLAHLPPA